MKLIYKCHCMARERQIDVTDRASGSEIAEWMDCIITPAISYDHRNLNRLCRAASMEYVKIPMIPDQEIGVKTLYQ